MNALDLYVDFTPLRTGQMSVTDESGAPLAAGWALPPLGGGLAYTFQRFGDEGAGLVVSADVAQTTPGYGDLGIDWAPTLWSLELDFGARAPLVQPGKVPVELAIVGGVGLRGAVLAQPWWDDYGYVGIGGHLGFDTAWGVGPVRGLLGVRASAALVPGAVQGTIDSAAANFSWAYAAYGARVGVHGGVSFR